MHGGRFILVVVLAAVAASFSDWLFMGVLFHEKYEEAPEIWRSSGGNERRLVLWSQLIGVSSCGAFACLCTQADTLTIQWTLGAAVIVWLAGPVVVIAQMVLWTKLHPLIGVSQSLGWLVRFIVTGLLAVWLL